MIIAVTAIAESGTDHRRHRGQVRGVGVAARAGGYKLEYEHVRKGNRTHRFEAPSDEEAIDKAASFLGIKLDRSAPLFKVTFLSRGGRKVIRLSDERVVFSVSVGH
ncbi:MAG: hypothetical protein AB199_00725 [Parcubacteria bacterium C7867-004]|nr:MAG: hypothetical protein AB199_00725 [Parcubacteria bacterium C7867-004]